MTNPDSKLWDNFVKLSKFLSTLISISIIDVNKIYDAMMEID